MADDLEKTEEPTPKKLEDARKEGNVPKSMEFSGFVILFISSLILIFYIKYITGDLEEYFKYIASLIGVELTLRRFYDVILNTLFYVFKILLPIMLVIVIAAIIANVSQIGFLFTIKPVIPNFEKINPIKGFKKLFSIKTFIESLKTILKVSIAFVVGYYLFLQFLSEIPKLALMSVLEQIKWFGQKSMILIFSMLGVFFVFALIDFVYQRYTYKKSLRMSKQEIKDEFKQTEGNPEVKAKIRQIQREMAKKRMISEVPKADVVITNPTHYAVAIRYDKNKENAPRVLAKGVDNLSLKIKEIARLNDIMIVENPPLARELYRVVEVGEIIPPKLFKAVAEILAYVYRAKRREKE